MPYCHTAVLPYCHTVILLYCHTAILLYCYTAILLYCQLHAYKLTRHNYEKSKVFFPSTLRTREISDIFNTYDEIYLVFTEKNKYPLYLYSDTRNSKALYTNGVFVPANIRRNTCGRLPTLTLLLINRRYVQIFMYPLRLLWLYEVLIHEIKILVDK